MNKYKLIISSNKPIDFRKLYSRGEIIAVTEGNFVVSQRNEPPVAEPPKPEPIMIGGKELKIGSKFILKPYDTAIGGATNIDTWNMLYGGVQIAKDPDYSVWEGTHYVKTESGYYFKHCAIDRIIEDGNE